MRAVVPFWTTRNLPTDLWREMDRLFDDFATPNLPIYDEREMKLASEVTEAENHFLVSIDIPGLRKDEINIEVSNNTLTISGERRREQKTEDHKVQRYERSYGAFQRSFALPMSVNADKIEAHYENGVLELYLPKTPNAQAKKIEVQTGKEEGQFKEIAPSEKI